MTWQKDFKIKAKMSLARKIMNNSAKNMKQNNGQLYKIIQSKWLNNTQLEVTMLKCKIKMTNDSYISLFS